MGNYFSKILEFRTGIKEIIKCQHYTSSQTAKISNFLSDNDKNGLLMHQVTYYIYRLPGHIKGFTFKATRALYKKS